MKEIDARGLACPAPVLQTKAAVESEALSQIHVLVDNEAARQNVSRFLASKGYETRAEEKGQDFVIIGTNDDPDTVQAPLSESEDTRDKKIMVMVAADRMGSGDDELGAKLMINFIKTLKEMGPELWHLVFVNSGVKLAVTGAETLDDLKEFEKSGLKILVCGTCLTHFDLLDQKQVGETTNMLDIVMAMQLADKVINI